MEPTATPIGVEAVEASDFEWYGPPTDGEPRQRPAEPPLGALSADDWAWLLSYKFDEWLELTVHEVRQGRTPREVSELKHRQRTFEFVQSMYDQGLTPAQWNRPMPPAADRYVELYKQLSAAQQAYLEDVGKGVIIPDFPDPAAEAEAHRSASQQ